MIVGINKEGKNSLGFWTGETESSSFWFNVLNELKSRGLKDVLLFSVDGLAGLSKEIPGSSRGGRVERLQSARWGVWGQILLYPLFFEDRG